MSPSSRRAWIEIVLRYRAGRQLIVALLAEGVDRNSLMEPEVVPLPSSPSSRRAWIEIPINMRPRNEILRRPPRGGRG